MSRTTDHIIDLMNAERDHARRRVSGPITSLRAEAKPFIDAFDNANKWLTAFSLKTSDSRPELCNAPRMSHAWLMHGAKFR